MATVIGVTKAYADAIEDKIIKSANRSGTSLILVTDAGNINVANAFPAPFEQFPIGCIYFTDRSANPSTYMGGGTWVRWGQGRVPVGVSDVPGSVFAGNGSEGGQATYTMTLGEMPRHNHSGNTGNESHDHYHNTPVGYREDGDPDWTFGRAYDSTDRSFNIDSSTGTSGASQNHFHSIPYEGGGVGATNNNLQPYITCYIWKRTA